MVPIEKNRWSQSFIHRGFEIGILLKAINGLLELIAGVLLIFVQPEMVRKIITVLTSHELSEDPHDVIVHWLMNTAHNFSISMRNFAIIYLTLHGAIKLFLVFSLWKQRFWAYPLAIIVFGLFAVYQVYRYTYTHSVELIFLTILDIAIIILTWLEYKRLQTIGHPSASI